MPNRLVSRAASPAVWGALAPVPRRAVARVRSSASDSFSRRRSRDVLVDQALATCMPRLWNLWPSYGTGVVPQFEVRSHWEIM